MTNNLIAEPWDNDKTSPESEMNIRQKAEVESTTTMVVVTPPSWSRSDHQHFHGQLVSGDLHQTFTTGSAGFVPAPVSSKTAPECDTSIDDRVLSLVHDFEMIDKELLEMDAKHDEKIADISKPVEEFIKQKQEEIDALMYPYLEEIGRAREEWANERKFMVGAQEDIKRNIMALAKSATKTVYGNNYMAVYTSPGFDYDKRMLDGLASAIPAIKVCGKPTPPKLILRRRTGKGIMEG